MSDDQSTKQTAPQGPSAATLLVRLAKKNYSFGITADGEPYALRRGGHVVRILRGGGLRPELARDFQRAHKKVAGQAPLADALLVLEGEAGEAHPREAHLRVAEHDGTVWIDLGDTGESVIRITDGDWSVQVGGVPVLFRRTKLTGAMPAPQRGGSVDLLWNILNVGDGEDARDERALVLATLVSALIAPNIPHPVLVFTGEQGTGKTTGARTVVSLLDPSPVELRKPPRDPDGWVTAAAGSWVVALDNISAIPDWLSDSLCRAVTGDGDVRRQLYTDGGLHVISFRRVIILNGIDTGALRGDLAERMVLLRLTRIKDSARRREADLAARIRADRPKLLGALLTLAAQVHQLLPTIELERAPRMADFAAVVAAVDQLLGTDALAHYSEQARTIAEDSLGADPFIAAMTEAIQHPGEFEGPAEELLHKITPGHDGWRAPRDWPKDSRAVTVLLRRQSVPLRRIGWVVEDQGSANKEHRTRWHLRPPAPEGVSPEIDRDRTSPRSPSSPPGEEASQASHRSVPSQVVLGEEASEASRQNGTSQVARSLWDEEAWESLLAEEDAS